MSEGTHKSRERGMRKMTVGLPGGCVWRLSRGLEEVVKDQGELAEAGGSIGVRNNIFKMYRMAS